MPIYKYTFSRLRSPRDAALFENYETAVRLFGPVSLKRYCPADNGQVEAPGPEQACEALYRAYNLPGQRPNGYSGRSMSVSDVVTLWDSSVEPPLRSDWYCDDIGFRRMEAES